MSTTLKYVPPGLRLNDVTPVGMTETKDGKVAIIALGHANHVAFVDTATRKVKSYVLVGKRAWGDCAQSFDKSTSMANGLSDDLTIVDTAKLKAVRTIPVGRVPHTVVVDD